MKNKPAVAGGRPVREKLLPMAKSILNDNDINAVTEVLCGGKLGSGEAVSLFEQAMAAYTGARYAVAVSSGAAGLHIALMSAAMGHMEEVITYIEDAAHALGGEYEGQKIGSIPKAQP